MRVDGMKIFVIDDMPAHSDKIGDVYLEHFAPVSVDAFYDYDAALKAAIVIQPHLIICDDLMPGTQAWEFAYQYLRRDPPRPFLACMTYRMTLARRARCEETGFDIYAEKPFTLDTLLHWGTCGRKVEMARAQGKVWK